MTTLSRAAVEEASHAFAAARYGGTVRHCEIFAAGGGRHRATGVPHDRKIHVKLAGLVGRRVVLGPAGADPDRSVKDVERAVRIALRATKGDVAKAEALIEAIELEVEALLEANRPALERLADRLDAEGTIDHATVQALIAEAVL